MPWENITQEFESLEHQIGKLGHWQFLIFAAGSSESGGILADRKGNGDWRGVGRSYFDEHVTWLGSPALLSPSTKIRVGIHGWLRNDDVRFDLELPSLI